MTRQQILLDMGLGPLWLPRAAPTSSLEVQAAPCIASSPAASIDDWATLEQAVQHCQACALHKTRQQALLGQGSLQPKILIVSDAPHAEDDAQAGVLTGPKGRLLRNLLQALRIDPEHTYWTYAVKCSPYTTAITKQHTQACATYLHEQIQWLQPQLVITLGQTAASALLKRPIDLSQATQTYYTKNQVPVFCIEHLATLLQNPEQKAQAWQVLKQVLVFDWMK